MAPLPSIRNCQSTYARSSDAALGNPATMRPRAKNVPIRSPAILLHEVTPPSGIFPPGTIIPTATNPSPAVGNPGAPASSGRTSVAGLTQTSNLRASRGFASAAGRTIPNPYGETVLTHLL